MSYFMVYYNILIDGRVFYTHYLTVNVFDLPSPAVVMSNVAIG